MSFGWSAGDIISAIEVLYHVGKALKDSGDADQRYKETSLFLETLAATLERVRTSDASVSIRDQVDALRAPVEKFCARLTKTFEKSLGKNSPKDWQGQLRSLRKRLRYELFDKVDVQEFKNEISAPLQGIQISLGLESFRLLSDIKSNLSDLQPASTSDIETLIERLLIQYRSETQEPTRVREVLQWVHPRGGKQMIDVYHDFRSGLLDGSCEWLFESAQYHRWRSNPEPSFLWITGIPGAGKTSLATRVVERLKSSEVVAYHFCDTNDSARCDFLNIIQTWVWQFLDQDKSKIDRVDSVRGSGAPPAEATMQDCLDHLVSSSDERKRVVILDGLDECPSEVRPKLCKLLVHLADQAKVLLFSRRLQDIFDELVPRVVAAKFEHFHISANDTEQDLTNFLETSVKEKVRLSDQNLELQIINSLRAGADGMFQWAALMIDDLAQPGKLFEEDYLKILQDLPRGIDALYGRILDGLCKSAHCERSQKLLQWIVCSRRPLTLEEVGEVLTLDKNYSRGKKTIVGLDLRQMVRQLCGPLVAIEVNDIERLSVVTLVHASAKDFLLDQSCKSKSFGALLVDSGEAHTQLAQACLATICNEKAEFLPLDFPLSEVVYFNAANSPRDQLKTLGRLRSIAQERVDDYLNSFPLMMYAATNWLFHLTAAKESPLTCGYARSLYTSTRNTTRWLQLCLCIRRTSVEDIWQLAALRKTSAGEGHAALEDWLAHLRGPPHSRITRWNSFLDGHGHVFSFLPAVHVAAYFDFDDIVKKHLNNGGDVNMRTYCGLTPLCLAARGDSLRTVQVLLQAGAEINPKGTFWDSPSPLKLSMDCHVNKINSKIGCYRSGQLDVVRLLLDAGAQAYSTEEDMRVTRTSSLHRPCLYAVRNDTSTLQLVDMLLAHGGKGNLETRSRTQHDVPLQCAARRGVPELVDLFLRNGADCESRCSSNDGCNGHRTALLIACCKESANMDVIRILLKAGASVKAKCHDGRTALHMAAAHPPELAELLLTHGAEVDAVSADGSLPIHEAVREHNFLVVKALVNHASQLDAKDGNGLSPLAIALTEGFDDATKVLIQAGAEPEPGYRLRGESNERTLETASQPSSTNTPPHEPQPGYWPRDYSDQFAAFRLLRRPGIGVELPEHLVLRILDLAEYWVKSIASCSDAKAVPKFVCGPPSETYVRSARITGRRENPVQKVRFFTRCHDMRSRNVEWNDRTVFQKFWWRYTLFEVQIVKRSGRLVDFRLNSAKDDTSDCQALMRNRHAKWESPEDDIVFGNGPGYRRCEWIDWLKPGEQLGITPRNLGEGLPNYIEFAQIEVFTTSLPLRVEEVRSSVGNTTVACNVGKGVGNEGGNASKSQIANSHESPHEVRLDEVRPPDEVRSVRSGVRNTILGQGDMVGKVWFWIIPIGVVFFAWSVFVFGNATINFAFQ